MTFEEVRLDLDTINCSISIHLHNCITIESVCLHEKKLTNWLSPQVHGYREKHLLRPCRKFLNPSESQFIQCHAYDIQFYNVYTVFKFGSRSLSSWHWHAPSHGFGRFGRCLGLQTDVEKPCFSQENHLQVGFPNLSFQEGALLTGRNCLWKRWHLGIV